MNYAEDSLLAGEKKGPGEDTKTSFFSGIDEIPEILRQPHFPSLDGLRAVSIIIVIVFHIFIAFGHVSTIFESPLNFNFADLGVQIFFVISGFLITTLLLKEKVSKGDINLKHFYIRRVFRILPVAFLYLFFVLILNFVMKLHLNMLFILASFLFLRNFVANVTGPNNLTTHYWSLAVEEQFYLIFPVILKKSLRLYICFLLAILLLSVLIDFTNGSSLFKLNDGYFRIIRILITQFQGIAIGSFFSIAIFKNRIRVGDSNISFKISALILLVVLLTLYSGQYGDIANILKCVCIATILSINLKRRVNPFFKLLNNKVMKLIGVLSFSIYIWQQPFTLGLNFFNQSSFSKRFDNKILIDIFIMGIFLVILGIISYVSYNFYEKKFLKLKERFK